MMNQYKNTPEIIFNKKVLLITHIRFWTDMPNYFLIYNPTMTNTIDAFDGNFSSLMSRTDLRQYIFFDETPTFIRPFCTIPKYILGNFLEPDPSTNKVQCKSYSEIKNAYDCFIRGTNADFFNETHNVSKLKCKSVLYIIQRLFSQWINRIDTNYSITFVPADLAQPVVNTHVFVFEGAGDVLIGNTSPYNLYDLQPKYNAQVEFFTFRWSLKRRVNGNSRLSFSESIESLKQVIISSIGATLIVVWRNMNDDSDNKTDFIEWVKENLDADSSLANTQYSITYFGASDTKSTNDYRIYSNIVLCGRWSIPKKDTNEFRAAFSSATTNFDHRAWYFIQLIARIGIRNHDGGNYNVYFSSDYDQDFIDCLKKYFNQNVYTPPLPSSPFLPDWEIKINNSNIRNDIRQNIKKLCLIYPVLQQWIMSENTFYDFDISLEDLFIVIPRYKKERNRYNNLKKEMAKLGIRLNIT